MSEFEIVLIKKRVGHGRSTLQYIPIILEESVGNERVGSRPTQTKPKEAKP